jgi:hypothetical protein
LAADLHLLSEFALRKKLLAWLQGSAVDKLKQADNKTSRYWVFIVVVVRGLCHGSRSHLILKASG